MAETRWLSEDEQRIWRAYLYASKALIERLGRDLQNDAGVSTSFYEILMRLSEAPERTMRMSELADQAQNSRSRLSHAVARLEELGWVRRESCPTDRRGSFAVLTDEGMAALVEAAPHHVESVRTHVFDQLTPAQLAELGTISQTILDHLRVTCDSDDPPCPDLRHPE